MIEGPGALAITLLLALEHFAEQALARAATQEYILARRMLVAEARRHGDPLDTELHRRIEKLRDFIRILTTEQSAVDGDPEALGARQPDGRDGLLVHTLQAHRFVVPLLVAVQVNGERQVLRRLVLIDML